MIADNFDILFRRQGFTNFTYQPEDKTDLHVLTQHWAFSPSGKEYAVDEFYQRFGQNSFRKMLGRIYTSLNGVPRQDLIPSTDNTKKLEDHLVYMCEQDLAVDDGTMVFKGERCQHITDIGRTLEWYVARWFQVFLDCPARYDVHVPGISGGGDLDVVAFMNEVRIWVECKSGRNIDVEDLELFQQRALEFTPVLAILLIDTDDKRFTDGKRFIDRCIDSLNKPLARDDWFELKNEREWLYFRGRGLYVVGVPHNIGDSLQAVLRLYHDRVRFVPFAGRRVGPTHFYRSPSNLALPEPGSRNRNGLKGYELGVICMNTGPSELPQVPKTPQDIPRKTIAGALLGGICIIFLAAMINFPHLDTPLRVATIAFAIAIPCLVEDLYWTRIKPSAPSLSTKNLDRASWIVAIVGYFTAALGLVAFVWHLWIVAGIVLIVAGILAPLATVGLSLVFGWFDLRRLRELARQTQAREP